MSEVFETVYNVPLTCDGCIESVSKEILKNEGVKNVKCDLVTQTVSVEASTPPSKIIESIQNTGRDAIVRGTGKPNSAAVCILEDFTQNISDPTTQNERDVYGLARLIKTQPDEMFVDLTLTGMKPNTDYYPSIRTSGDLSNGPLTTGNSIFNLPKISCDDKGKCQQFVSIPFGINNLIGRAVTVSSDSTQVFMNSMTGVIARSAGAWENDKYVCSCTGKNIWQERTVAVERGIN
ncbi:copper chaperone [Pichia californica]|uniref:Superoxide dismutase 1 copper chaperone n=1 Tax=Pichia californica TaxID=460514 RepID=A0A9P6WL43_9ASCO|nr:copper chaperone [[Candida] californica]KAG0689154.1 copper chaperone [[Candida] californica]